MSDSIKVLIVDDEDQFRATTKKILDRRGFVTILAANGEEAIEKIKEKPDVVVLDVKMPGLDGLGTLAEIKTLAPEVPVIMLTGHGSEPSAKYAQTQGAFDYLAKPCDIDILTSKIKEALRPELADGFGERNVGEVMIPIDEYTTLNGEATVREAIQALHESFRAKAAAGRIMETGHRSILITDHEGEVIGILAITDLLDAIMPGYLKAPKPSTADSVRYSPCSGPGCSPPRSRTWARSCWVRSCPRPRSGWTPGPASWRPPTSCPSTRSGAWWWWRPDTWWGS